MNLVNGKNDSAYAEFINADKHSGRISQNIRCGENPCILP